MTSIKQRGLKRLVIAALCLIAQIPLAGATTYYISSSQGNDTNSGTNINAPWKSLVSVYNRTYGAGIFKPDDSILLKANDSFDGPLLINQDGTNGSPITIGRYGTGANPIIYGDHPSATWSAVPGHAGIYSTLIGPNGMVQVQSVYDVNGNPYTKSTQGTNTLNAWLNTFATNTWGGDGTIYIRTPDGNPPPRMRLMEQSAVYPSGSYITIQDLEVCNSYIGIQPLLGEHVIIQNNFVHDTLNCGIYFSACSYSTMASNTVLRTGNTQLYMQYGGNNRIHHNTCSISGSNSSGCIILGIQVPLRDNCGVGLQEGTNNLVEYNSFSYIYRACLDYYFEVNTTSRFNYGFHCGTGASAHGTGNSIHHNIFDCDGVGKGIVAAQAYDPRYNRASNTIPTLIYNNVVYNCSSYGITASSGTLLTATSTNVFFRNNVIVTMLTYASLGLFYSGVNSDYNLFYCTAGTSDGWRWNGSLYGSLAAMQTVSGQEKNSIYANPQFVSTNPVSAVDFRLKATSLGINAGMDLKNAGLLTSEQDFKDYLGTLIPQGPGVDIGVYERGTNRLAPPTNLRRVP